MTVVAFALAIGGAFGFKSLHHSRLPTMGWANLGPHEPCFGSFIPQGCATTGMEICTLEKDSYYQNPRLVRPLSFFFTE